VVNSTLQTQSRIRNVEHYLAVGTLVILNIEDRARYRTVLRGWQPGQYLILDSPMIGEGPVFLRRGQPCVLRFVAQGAACGISSIVVERASIEVPLLRIRWPEQIEVVRVRRHERIELMLPCRIICEDDAEMVGELSDLSVGGCKIYSKTTLPENSLVRLSFVLPDGSAIERAKVEVRSIAKVGRGGLHGCRFLGDDDRVSNDIEFFVSATLQRLRAPGNVSQRALILGPSSSIEIDGLRDALEEAGCGVTTASGAVNGFFRVRMMPPSVVVVSEDLGEITGSAFCRVLKNTPAFRSLPVFVYGGDVTSARQAALAAGAAGYLPDIHDVEAVAQELMRHLSSQREASTKK